MADRPRLIIVSNRLPVKVKVKNEEIWYQSSEGGLATGLNSLSTSFERHWIGWPGVYPSNDELRKEIEEKLEQQQLHGVFLTREQAKHYYEGYANSTLWPLFHYFFVYVRHDPRFWTSYIEVNRLFLQKVLAVAGKNDIIWVHDYHLMLLPGMIRKELPDARIGFFLHIPFPSYELFRSLTHRQDLLEGMLGSDLIGFHTYDYMRHFLSTVYRIMGLESYLNTISYQGREISVDSFPMGIDYNKYNHASELPQVQEYIQQYKTLYGNRKLILSVDRLDYSKGILHRLRAFTKLLDENPEVHGTISLILIVVPSRSQLEQYHKLKVKIDEMIGAINGTYSQMGWIPVHYLYQSLNFDQLTALYYIADIALVTPLRDGMNLVAKEYVAAKKDQPGVLILSEMAGASLELPQALIINPHNIGEITGAIHQAINMDPEEQKERMHRMQEHLLRHTVHKWASDFIGELQVVHIKEKQLQQMTLTATDTEEIGKKYREAKQRVFILDYDGTLVSFSKDPGEATPDEELMQVIQKMRSQKNLQVYIISGRDPEFLGTYLGNSGIHLVAEHGAFFYENLKWIKAYKNDKGDEWKKEIREIMLDITEKTPGSFIEEKHSSLVWHYRKTDAWLADLRVNQLIQMLVYTCTRQNLHLMKGNKLVEVKVPGVNKGTAVKQILQKKQYDFILAIGDDITDEDMFQALPSGAYSIKVGSFSKSAGYQILSSNAVRHFLMKILE